MLALPHPTPNGTATHRAATHRRTASRRAADRLAARPLAAARLAACRRPAARFAGALATSLATGLLLVALAGCAAPDAPTAPPSATAPNAAVAAPGSNAQSVPAPGSTLSPTAGAWDSVRIPAGLTLAVVASADDASAAVVAAVERFALLHDATVTVSADPDAVRAVDAAIASAPDVIVGIGPAVIGALDLASASNLQQQFLLLGAQLPEPTGNVTAVIWAGADARDESTAAGPVASPERAVDAVAAGLASIIDETTGFVLDLDG